ncbi:diacylglycerol kinase family protein [Nocardia sp. NPDC052001]|uniref:diacylglycerol kinase family protein n=1 Tax=Nocardia sp. NPDC052001 TaxID=3154853 RepID=UPI00341FC118
MSPLPVPRAIAGVASLDLLTYPCSEWGLGLRETVWAANYLAERGVRVRQLRGASFESSIQLLRERFAGPHRPDALVCVGGDDLIAVALQATAPSGTPLGLLPIGPVNRLAATLGLPRHDLRAAAEIALAGKLRRIDLGLIESSSGTTTPIPPSWFATVVHAGIGGAGADRNHRTWSLAGRLRPASRGTGLSARPFRLDMACADGACVNAVETEGVQVSVGRAGNGGARADDGQLEVALTGAAIRYRTTAVALRAPGVGVTVDGTPLGQLPVTIRAVAAAQSVVVP